MNIKNFFKNAFRSMKESAKAQMQAEHDAQIAEAKARIEAAKLAVK